VSFNQDNESIIFVLFLERFVDMGSLEQVHDHGNSRRNPGAGPDQVPNHGKMVARHPCQGHAIEPGGVHGYQAVAQHIPDAAGFSGKQHHPGNDINLHICRKRTLIQPGQKPAARQQIHSGRTRTVQKAVKPVRARYSQMVYLILDFRDDPKPGQVCPMIRGSCQDKLPDLGYVSGGCRTGIIELRTGEHVPGHQSAHGMGHNGDRARVCPCQVLHLIKKQPGRGLDGLIIGIGHDKHLKPAGLKNRDQVIPDDPRIIQTVNQNHPALRMRIVRRGTSLNRLNTHPVRQIPGRFRKPVQHRQMKIVPQLILMGQYHLTAHLEQNHQQQHQAHEHGPPVFETSVKLIVGIFHI